MFPLGNVNSPDKLGPVPLAQTDSCLRQVLKRLNRIGVLVVDDWAMTPMSEAERRDF